MQKHALVLTTSAFVLVCGALAAKAQQTGGPFIEHSGQPQMMQQGQAIEGQGRAAVMGGGGMMGGRMGQGAMGAPLMMRMIFALMDADGDGTISLDEFKAAHERIFKAMDANKDGKLTPEEMLAFMRGTSIAAPRP